MTFDFRVAVLGPDVQRREVLNWFHLLENRPNVGGSLKRLKQAQALLWKGQVDATIALFTNCKGKQAQNFCHYLDKHRARIINYEYHKASKFVRLVLGQLNLPLNRLTVELRDKLWEATAEALCQELGMGLLIVDGDCLLNSQAVAFGTAINLVCREARLQQAALY